MKKITLLVVALAALGCTKSQPPEQDTKLGADIPIPQSLIGNTQADPSEVLVEINGKSLTRGEAMRQVALRLGGPPPADMPAGRVAIVRNMAISEVVDQFVKRVLLLQEADRLGITATDEEIKKGLELIQSKTPEGEVAKGIVADGPAGTDSLRSEVIIGIKIDKLMAQTLPVTKPPTDAEVDAFIQANASKLTHPEKGPLPRERVIAVMKARARAVELTDYVRGLLEKADLKHASSVTPLKAPASK